MFTRSAKNQDENAGNHLNFLIAGEQIKVKIAAADSPSRLGLRIAEGEDVIAIWFDWENQAELTAVSQRIGYALQPNKLIAEENDLPSIHHMDQEEILEFCKTIQVHPAHLVPLKPAPEFSLPTPLLELLLSMSNVKGVFSADDVQLAKAAVACESKRINSFLYDRSLAKKNQNREGADGLSLTEVFTSVIDNPVLLAKLTRETRDIHAVLPQDASEKYPVAIRVKNIALSHLEASIDRIKNGVRDKEVLLNKSLECVEDEYSKIFNAKTSLNGMLLFISDIKDELFDNQIEPKAATISNIVDALKKCDFTESYLEQSYSLFNIVFGNGQKIEETAQDFLIDLAESVAVHFATEERLSKEKRRGAESIDTLPMSTDIEALFKQKNFQEGTLFRRLMENHAIIAMDAHANSTHSTPAPK